MFGKNIFRTWAAEEEVQEKKLDPVGQADADIDNDGDVDKSDKYLANRRKAISKNIKKKKGETASMNPKVDTGNSKEKAGEMEQKESKDLDATNEDVTHETESGTAKITKTHVHFDNSGYKQKFSHKEVHKMSNGGKVRGFSLEKDNPYHGKDNHVYSNGDEEHHLPTKHLAKLNKESTIRQKLMAVLESDRAKHYKGATKPQDADELEKNNKGAMDMRNTEKETVDKLPAAFDDVSKAGRAGPNRKMRNNDNKQGDNKIINKVKEAYQSMYTVTLDDLEESMLGHRDAEKLNGGKSKDPNFKSPESHIDYHHRQSGGHEKSGGDADRHRYNVAKKLGYDV